MKNQQRFQNQKPNTTRAQSPTVDLRHTNDHTGESTSDQPQTSINKSITKTSIAGAPTSNGVAALAYQIYLQEGCPQGRNVQHWLAAEAQLAVGPTLTIKKRNDNED